MKSYKKIRNCLEDFIVSYKLYSKEEGGREITYQHLRCDFLYEEDDFTKNKIYMIHPEFIDKNGKPFNKETPIPLLGNASMWILNSEIREKIHKFRIKVGVKGYFMEGKRKIGEVIVKKIVSLNQEKIG